MSLPQLACHLLGGTAQRGDQLGGDVVAHQQVQRVRCLQRGLQVRGTVLALHMVRSTTRLGERQGARET
jgi:hypothetical protein